MPTEQALLDTKIFTRKWEEGLANLQAQINQSSSPNSSQAVNWSVVDQLAGELLQADFQHFQIVAYWGVARLHQQGFQALIEAADKFLIIVNQFWQQALPPVNRLRGRLAAIEWWVEQSLLWIEQSLSSPVDGELRDKAIQVIRAVDQSLEQRCASIPSLFSLVRALQQLVVSFQDVETVVDIDAASLEKANSYPSQALGVDGNIAINSQQVSAVPPLAASHTLQLPMIQESALVEMLRQIKSEVAEGRYQQALDRLQPYQQQLIGRERLQVTCYIADCLRQAGCMKLAALQIQKALSLVTQHQLESWDPPLAQQVLESAFDLSTELGKSDEAAELLSRLCLLNSGRAFYKSCSTMVQEKSYGK